MILFFAIIDFKIDDCDSSVKVFTTRPDTLFGSTYLVISPEHNLVKNITTKNNTKIVEEYCKHASKKSELQRLDLNKDKTGVFTGSYAINPANNNKIQIWIADYVLTGYGTGAIMAVPGHDQRDFEFAQKYFLDIVRCISVVSLLGLGLVGLGMMIYFIVTF